jgi:polyphosphate kinase
MSENIRVISILGRFLEHARVFHFETAVETTMYIGSADMMPRNLDNRIEVITPLRDRALRERLGAALETELLDTGGSWELASDGHWQRRSPAPGMPPAFAQETFMRAALAAATPGGESHLTQREETADRIHRGRSADG